MSFAGYSFCKGHSASYIQVAQHSCYLRAHYPAEFMAAVLANGGGFYHAVRLRGGGDAHGAHGAVRPT